MLSLDKGEQNSDGVLSSENFAFVFSEKPQHLLKQHGLLSGISVSQV